MPPPFFSSILAPVLLTALLPPFDLVLLRREDVLEGPLSRLLEAAWEEEGNKKMMAQKRAASGRLRLANSSFTSDRACMYVKRLY